MYRWLNWADILHTFLVVLKSPTGSQFNADKISFLIEFFINRIIIHLLSATNIVSNNIMSIGIIFEMNRFTHR
jgi:hypothetical protein